MTSGRHLLCHVVLSLALVAIATAQPPLGPCPSGWTKSVHTGTCVEVFHEGKSWDEARATCQEHQADLVKIMDKHMNQFMSGIISFDSGHEYWIGLQSGLYEDGFHWLDESDEIEYDSWGKFQPMHKNYFHRCVEMGKEGHDPGEWSTRDCDIKSKFICEKPQTVPTKDPCPSGWTKSLNAETCVKLFQDEKSWQVARDTCKDNEADLVKIMDKTMNQFLWGLISLDTEHQYWIGMHDLARRDTFRWLDESGWVEYENWGENQPNYSIRHQRCVEIGNRNYEDGKWTDNNCLSSMKFICEKLLTDAMKDAAATSDDSSTAKSSKPDKTANPDAAATSDDSSTEKSSKPDKTADPDAAATSDESSTVKPSKTDNTTHTNVTTPGESSIEKTSKPDNTADPDVTTTSDESSIEKSSKPDNKADPDSASSYTKDQGARKLVQDVNGLGAGAVTGIIIATLVACVALVGATILGTRFYLGRQPKTKRSYYVESSTECTNVTYDPTKDSINVYNP